MTATSTRQRRERRRLLRLIAFGSALPASASLPGLALPSRRVAVVGAGLAGLAAATLLRNQGVEVVVFEARQRVGGRVRTIDHLPGHPEGGANVIGPNYGRVLDAARRHDVALRNAPRGPDMGYLIGGVPILEENWPEASANPLQGALRALPPPRLLAAALRDNPLQASTDWCDERFAALDQSAAEYLSARGYDAAAMQLVSANNSYGNRLEDTSILSLMRVAANFSRAIAMRQPAREAVLGNSRVPEALAAALGPALRMNARVSRVAAQGGSVKVEHEGGTDHFDAAVLAVPVPALRNMQFDAALSGTLREAIAGIEYHKVTQVHLLVREPYWDGETPGAWWTDGGLGRLFLRPGDPSNLTVWINGDHCDRFRGLSDADITARVIGEIERSLPQSRGTMDPGHVMRWAEDPLAGGSWAVWAPGQIARWFDALAAPAGRLFFAGEHTARSNPGMEGAMESGERAALEVMRILL
jgi:monoamine oxidase